jgi:hypothetical protein
MCCLSKLIKRDGFVAKQYWYPSNNRVQHVTSRSDKATVDRFIEDAPTTVGQTAGANGGVDLIDDFILRASQLGMIVGATKAVANIRGKHCRQ